MYVLLFVEERDPIGDYTSTIYYDYFNLSFRIMLFYQSLSVT